MNMIAQTLPLLLCAGFWGCGHGEMTDAANMRCVKRLKMPAAYPAIAESARSSFEVTAVISVEANGRVQSVAFEGASDGKPAIQNLFKPTIETTIRESEFEPACAGQTVRMVYVFRMDVPSSITAIAAFWFGYPNRVEVWGRSPFL
jgi:hypothetical protein